ncbi:MAG: FAD-dependent oxidoreductase, partial [Desulfuromonadales bacterium]|nr:FAD-dependent oxidoreductase [Desulfuromonadales bacterium]NIR32969.1 FAD-dependent oxidoreductase [Desulfuromonadales bacterium]NIS40527.1 FAD-dependent oxidoreductase [Desulfuromonadales bacterium]
MAARHLVLVGGGHAHLTALKKLREESEPNFRVTLIDPSYRHFYAGMAAGLLSGIYDERDACIDLRAVVDGDSRFLQSRVERIDTQLRRLLLSCGQTVSYDAVSFCIGRRILLERVSGDSERMLSVLPVDNLLAARRRIIEGMKRGAVNLVVAGGGPAGVEAAAHLWRLQREAGGSGRICLAAGGRLLRGFAPRFRTLALESLRRRGIEVCEGVRVVHVEEGRALFSDETERKCD